MWNVISSNIDLNKANNESKVYYCFCAAFMADTFFRLLDKGKYKEIVQRWSILELEKNNGDVTEFIHSLFDYINNLESNHGDPLELNFTISLDLKLRISVVLGCDRLYGANANIKNSLTKAWVRRLSLIAL